MPTYDRDRQFQGFRGFGIVRTADAVIDPEGLGLALAGYTGPDASRPTEDLGVSAAETSANHPAQLPSSADQESEADDTVVVQDDPFQGEPPVLMPVQAKSLPANDDKIIRLDGIRASRQPEAAPEKPALSANERSAFREIAERLRRDVIAPVGTENGDHDAVPAGDSAEAPIESQPSLAADTIAPRINPADDMDGLTDSSSTSVYPMSPDVLDESGTSAEPDSDYSADPWLDQPFDQRKDKSEDAPILAKLDVPVLIHNGSGLLHANPAFFDFTGFHSLEELEAAGGLDRLFHSESGDETQAPMALIRTAQDHDMPVRAHLHSGQMERFGRTVVVIQSD